MKEYISIEERMQKSMNTDRRLPWRELMQSIKTNVQSLIYAFKENALDVLSVHLYQLRLKRTHVSRVTQQTLNYKVKIVTDIAAISVM